MVRKRTGGISLLVFTALLAALITACSVLADVMFDTGGGRIADGIDAPFGGNAMYAYAAEYDKPVIESISIKTASVSQGSGEDDDSDGTVTYTLSAGSSFKVALTFEETELTISGAAVVFKCIASGTTISAGSETTALTDDKYINVVIPDSTKGGVYIIERITLKDSQDRIHIYYNPDIYQESFSAHTMTELKESQRLVISVKSDVNDTQAPQIGLIDIEKAEAEPGEELIFAIEAEDASQTVKNAFNSDVTYTASGLNSLKITWQRADEDGEQTLLNRYAFTTTVAFADMKKNGVVYQGTFKVPSRLIEGTYYIKNVEIDDRAGNTAVYVNPNVTELSEDGQLVLPDSACNLCINVSSQQSQGTAAVKNASLRTSSVTSAESASEYASDETVIVSVIEDFELNSFGKMAAYVILKGSENSDELDGLDDDALAYAAQSFRFSVSADTDAVGINSSLSVGKILSGSLYTSAKTAVESKSQRSVVFDISLLDESGEAIQPDGVVSVSTDIPDDFDKSTISVYRLSDDGEKCYKLDSTVSGDRITFTTDHFSVFVISQDSNSAAAVAYSPGTADEEPLAALAFVMMGAAFAGIVNARRIRSRG